MKKVFELYINDKFIQYIKPSELHLLKWYKNTDYKLIPLEITDEIYKLIFSK